MAAVVIVPESALMWMGSSSQRFPMINDEIVAWLQEACQGHFVLKDGLYATDQCAVEFEDETDAVLFRMTWC